MIATAAGAGAKGAGRRRMAAEAAFSDCIRARAVGTTGVVFSYTAINAVMCFVNNGLAAKTHHRAWASVSRSLQITKSTFANFVPKFNFCPTGRLCCWACAQYSGATTGGNRGSRLWAPLERGRRVQTAIFLWHCHQGSWLSRGDCGN